MPFFSQGNYSSISLLPCILIAAIILTLMAGLLLVVGALLGAMVAGLAVAFGPTPLLLVAAIVLHIVVIVLLALLLYCTGCFGGGRKGGLAQLFSLIALLGPFKTALVSLGQALAAIETVLGQLQTNLNSAAETLAEADPPVVLVPTFQTQSLGTVFAGTPVAPAVQMIEANYDANSQPLPQMISGLELEEKEIPIGFLGDVLTPELFTPQLTLVSLARQHVEELVEMLE